jgi:hypothetical protein
VLSAAAAALSLAGAGLAVTGKLSAPSSKSSRAGTTAASDTAATFSDGFETGDLSQWTASTGLTVQQQEVFSGAWAARGTTTGPAANAYKLLSTPQTRLYARTRFKMISQSQTTVILLRLRTATGASIARIYLTSSQMLATRNDITGTTITSSTKAPLGSWHTVEVRMSIADTASQIEVVLDGTTVAPLTHTDSLGTTPIGRVQIGDDGTGKTYDIAFDDVLVATLPTVVSAPSIAGSPQEGQTLSANPGTWSGSEPLSYAYQWRRCDAAGANCNDIAGATAASYIVAAADVGATLRVAVTASNVGGSSTATSAATAAVVAAPPAVVTLPAISGSAQEGQTLTASPGTWTGTVPLSYAYQWRRCDSGGAGCVDIAGETSSSYALVSADVGSTVRVAVTASNSAGSGTAASAATAVVTTAVPVNVSPPMISGSAQEGQTLTASPGSWTGVPPLSYAYQWQRCDSGGAGCVDIAGETSSSYALVSADVGSTVRVAVTASNSAGSGTATSAATAVVPAAPPVNTALPTISGTARDGELLTATRGTWTGTPPLAYAYQWRRCDSGGNGCVDITGATATTYRLTSPDVGATIRVVVTTSGSGGTASASSTATAVVAGILPANATAPHIDGIAREGEVLTANVGTWTGSTPIAFTYQWRRCTLAGTPCVDIAGATGSTYTAGPVDVSATIRVIVTATNSAGTSSATTAPTAAIAALAPPPGDPVVAAAGDIACDPASPSYNGGLGTSNACRQKYTSDLLVNAGLTAVLPLGDNQYDCGGYQAYLQSYDPTWGRVKSISHPTPGDQEYAKTGTDCDQSGKAGGYFQYFGAAAGDPSKGYYSYDIGTWHLIVLNSNCTKISGGCKVGSQQEKWLKADLASHPSTCTLAYYQHPRFASAGDSTSVDPLWRDLAAGGVELALNGNKHVYERFAPQNAAGAYDPAGGMREFVVGTGGKSLNKFGSTFELNSEVHNDNTFGVLKITLHATSYDWQFVHEANKTFTDSGSTYCH